MVIRRIGVWSASRLYGAVSASMGLLVGVLIACASLVGGAAGVFGRQGAESASAPLGMMLGVGAVVALPLFYGVLGLLAGAVVAALYNLFAGLFGGIELETEP